MSTPDILWSLLRTTLVLTLCGSACFISLRKIENHLPHLSRFLWLAVLLVGWFWIRPVVSIPWNESVRINKPVAAVAAESVPEPIEVEQPRLIPHQEMAMPPEAIVVAPVSTVVETKSFDWKPLILPALFAVWIGGMVVSIFLAAAGYIRFLALLRKTVPAGDDFAGPWRRLLEEQGIDSRSIPMFVSDGRDNLGPALIRTVCVSGMIRKTLRFFVRKRPTEAIDPNGAEAPTGRQSYCLVVPRELWSELSEAGRCGILKHEREHFRRRDVWKSFFVRILALPHWFNPMAHLAVHRFEEAAELLCDRAAFSDEKEGISEFARILLLLHENAPTQFVVRQSIFGRGLKRRVACLLHENHETRVSTMKKILLITGATILLAAALFRVEFVAKSVAETPKTEDKTMVSVDPDQKVELRLTVHDEKDNPVPGTKIQLKADSGSLKCALTILDLGVADAQGKLNATVPSVLICPDTSLSFYQREKRLFTVLTLHMPPKNWKKPEPYELTTKLSPTRRMTGIVVDAGDKPVAGAFVTASFIGPLFTTTTDEAGRFELDVNPVQPCESLSAFKSGVGAGMISPDFPLEESWKAMGDESHWEQWRKNRQDGLFTIKIQSGEKISVRVVDPEGNPIEGICAYPSYFSTKATFWNMWNFGELNPQRTDKNGMITFDWIPTRQYHIISFSACGTDPRIDKESKANRYGKGEAVWREASKNNDLVISLPKKIMLEGSVRYEDGSIPSQGTQLFLQGKDYGSFGINTDYDGRFVFFANADEIVSLQPIYNPHRGHKPEVAPTMLRVDVGNGKKPAPRFDFVLKPGTKVYGIYPVKVDSFKIFEMSGPNDTIDNQNERVCFERNDGKYETLLPPGTYRFKIGKKESGTVLELKGDKNEIELDFDGEGRGKVSGGSVSAMGAIAPKRLLTTDRPDVRVYAVNKQVKDFSEKEDLSTPEGKVVSLIRTEDDLGSNPGVSQDAARSAEILEVRVFRDKYAMVLVNVSHWKYMPLSLSILEKKDKGWSRLSSERLESVEMFAAKFAGAIPRWEKSDQGHWVAPDKFQSTHLMVLAPKGDFKPRFMIEMNQKLAPLWKEVYNLPVSNMKTWPENDDLGQKTLVVGFLVNDPESVREFIEKKIPDLFVQRIEKLNDKIYTDYVAGKNRNINGQLSHMDATQNTHVVIFTGKDDFKPKTINDIQGPVSQAMRKGPSTGTTGKPVAAGWTKSWVEDGRLVGALLTNDPELLEKVVNELPGHQVLRVEKLTDESLKEYQERVSTGLDSEPRP